MRPIDGRAISRGILTEAKKTVAREKLKPGLAIILVGDDPASQLYVSIKERACQRVGIIFEKRLFPATATETEVIEAIQELNQRPDIHGLVVQLPLPGQLDEKRIISAIDPQKDVDGFHPDNIKKILAGEPSLVPALTQSTLTLIRSTNTPLAGKRAAVLANSREFFEPLAYFLEKEGVKSFFLKAQDNLTKAANYDIVIIAVGRPKTLKQVKPGAIVIDVGINQTPEGVVGDVDAEALAKTPGWLTPVPGGVGPVTVASLLANTVKTTKLLTKNRP